MAVHKPKKKKNKAGVGNVSPTRLAKNGGSRTRKERMGQEPKKKKS